MTKVVVLDYGSGNVRSVVRMLERIGADVDLTADPDAVRNADGLYVPGVGNFHACMAGLNAVDGGALIGARLAAGRPVLGVCVGYQVLFDGSVEPARAQLPGLGLWPGTVARLTADVVPHMGWSRLERVRDDPLLEGVGPRDYAYFVHGYVCPDGPATLARADYGGVVPAVVRSANRWGCQFHPERSAEAGATILKNFLGLPC